MMKKIIISLSLLLLSGCGGSDIPRITGPADGQVINLDSPAQYLITLEDQEDENTTVTIQFAQTISSGGFGGGQDVNPAQFIQCQGGGGRVQAYCNVTGMQGNFGGNIPQGTIFVARVTATNDAGSDTIVLLFSSLGQQ